MYIRLVKRAAQLDKLREMVMNTTSTPKTLADLKSLDWVIDLKKTDTPKKAAEEIFEQLHPTDERPIFVRHLFTEGEIKVYEAYKDSGSDDYIYIKETI